MTKKDKDILEYLNACLLHHIEVQYSKKSDNELALDALMIEIAYGQITQDDLLSMLEDVT